mmetsp:Transcript_36893/g.92696  ORF Transcript_36893/g.92696 Transcript_36893/m.92696 type:complete len:211 (+) Transcript_36893:143-775(+)
MDLGHKQRRAAPSELHLRRLHCGAGSPRQRAAEGCDTQEALPHADHDAHRPGGLSHPAGQRPHADRRHDDPDGRAVWDHAGFWNPQHALHRLCRASRPDGERGNQRHVRGRIRWLRLAPVVPLHVCVGGRYRLHDRAHRDCQRAARDWKQAPHRALEGLVGQVQPRGQGAAWRRHGGQGHLFREVRYGHDPGRLCVCGRQHQDNDVWALR